MSEPSRTRLRRSTFMYWMLLLYIVAALVWWFISLINQNEVMRDFETRNLEARIDRHKNPVVFQQEADNIKREYRRNQSKYIGEGSIFFLLIMIGAAFVYRSVRRQFRLQLQQQNFMMAVTHELKTPISITRLNLETLQRYALDPDKQKKLIRKTLDETERLNFLTNNILIASQLDGQGYKPMSEELDLSSLLRDRVQDFRVRFPERNIEQEIVDDVDIKGDPLLLQMLINNLLENAIKYSPKEKQIRAGLLRAKGSVELRISDEGPGIPDDEKKKIFSKFYRVGNESTRKTQGTGLGLYLCQKIAKSHNADILVTNNLPAGSTFVVIFKTHLL